MGSPPFEDQDCVGVAVILPSWGHHKYSRLSASSSASKPEAPEVRAQDEAQTKIQVELFLEKFDSSSSDFLYLPTRNGAPPENTFSYKIYKELCSEPAAGKSTQAAMLRERIACSLLAPLGSAWQMTKSKSGNKVQAPRPALARLLPRKRMTNARQQQGRDFLLLVEETQRITLDAMSISPVPSDKHKGSFLCAEPVSTGLEAGVSLYK